MIGMVLPQGMWAGVTIDTSTPGKVIVTSENAGDFATYLNNATTDQLNSLKVDEIVFVGKFNASDLSTLQSKNCATQKKVDMAEAKFIKSTTSSAEYSLYKTTTARDNSQASEGSLCVVNGTLWKKERQNPPVVSWVPATEDDYNSAAPGCFQNADGWFDDTNKESHNGEVGDGWYYKVPISGTGAPYVYYKVEKTTTLGWNQLNYNDGDKKNSVTLFADEDEMNADTSAPDYSEAIVGGTVYKYTNGSWQPVSSGDGEYDYTQMKFDYWGNNVEEIITSNYATGAMAGQLCSDCSNLKTLTLSAGDFTGSKLGNNITHLETVNIQNQVTALGSGMFNQAGKEGTGNDATQHLTTVTFQDGCRIQTLPNSVFKDTGIRNLSVPSSVELIEAEAFSSCQNLEVVTFVDTNPKPLVIKSTAFQQSDHIKHIYLNVDPSDRLLICEYNAFDFHSMEGQTAEGSEMATLHFAEENFDYYAGEWKKGMAFKQADLNSFKDGIEIKDDQGNVIYAKPNTQDPGSWGQYGFGAIESYGEGNVDGYYHDPNGGNTKYAPANGWQQFAKIESKREIEITGNVYMTYSTATPYSLPKGIVAFRVTDYKYAVKNAKGYDTNGTLILKAIDQVPTETGMLLISTSDYVIKTSDVNANPNVQSVFYFGDPDGEPDKYHYTMGKAGDATSNYLAPAVHGIAVGPVSQDNPDAETGAINVNGRPFTHRNFAMHKTSHQFVRLTHCTMPDNRAFLSLPITKFDNPDEGPEEGPTPTQTLAGKDISLYDGYDPYTTEAGAKASLVFDYDVEKYGMIWPLIKDNNLGITTGIKNVNVETVQEGIYTLQGVKVSAPSTKGIYIVNGKKVIIK
jgi:hypothetical protein